jgi:hypothetical protein
MKKTVVLVTVFICFLITGYCQAGEPDSTFGSNGIVRTDVGAKYDYGSNAVQILSQP